MGHIARGDFEPEAVLCPTTLALRNSGRAANPHEQEILYITERCVLRLEKDGVTVAELAPGVDLERDVLAQAEFPLRVAKSVREMDPALFHAAPINLQLRPAADMAL
jgi:acyl CoA:acetate/3-ketoacid CoA transferase